MSETNDDKTSKDEPMMRRALDLARKGAGKTRPNPLVGAVIARGGEILGEGFHERAGEAHAETRALEDAERRGHVDVSGSTVYVTLEPCCHVGRTGPCADLLISRGVSRVVCGMADPDPRVSGGGIARLRAAGVEVTVGALSDECLALNRPFVKRVTRGLPYVTLKYAMSLDGKTATRAGDARWISSAESREETHRLRSESAAVMCGVGTVLADDPLLTARPKDLPDPPQPVRVIVDSSLRVPLSSRVVSSARDYPTLIACASDPRDPADPQDPAETGMIGRSLALEGLGVAILRFPVTDGRVDLRALFEELARRGLDSVFLEGGGTLAFSALESGLVDRVIAYVSPILIGGRSAPSPVGGIGFAPLAAARSLENVTVSRSGADVRVEAYPCSPD